jgi:Zn ribbon nucleic-acid-binding protein
MHQVPASTLMDRAQSLWLQYCPNCDPPRVMTIKTIQPAMWRGYDMVIYECQKCGYEKIYKME